MLWEFGALIFTQGMGGAGLVDTKPSTDSNVAVYSTFAIVGFFAGTLIHLYAWNALANDTQVL